MSLLPRPPRRRAAMAAIAAAAALAPVIPATALAAAGLEQLMAEHANWAAQAGDYANHRHSTLSEINAGNVNELRLAWSMPTGVLRADEGSPLVVGDTLYMATPFPSRVYAVNLAERTLRWRYEPRVDPSAVPLSCCDLVSRGLAYGDGKILLQQADTTLVALDARSGAVVWTAKNGDARLGETNTNAPHVFRDKVLTGIAGAEFGVRGRVLAYDIRSGEKLWTAWSTGPDSELLVDPAKTMTWTNGALVPVGKDSSLRSWQGSQWQLGGGTTEGWYAYDPRLNLVYYGSGKPGNWNPAQRPGDNRWSATIFARDLDSGQAKWVYQVTPHDEWGFDGVNEMVLFDIDRGGRKVPVLAHLDRNGFGYVLNRQTGELLVAEKFDPAVNWATRVDRDSGRPVVERAYPGMDGQDVEVKGVCPASGPTDRRPASYDPRTGLVLVPVAHACMSYRSFPDYAAGQPYVGASLTIFPVPGSYGGMGSLIAWDPMQGKAVWSDPERFFLGSGVLTTDGDVAFYGTVDGYLKAVSVKDGRELWKFKLPSAVIGDVFTYEYQGRQYVGVYGGTGGSRGTGMAARLTEAVAGATLFVFSLPPT